MNRPDTFGKILGVTGVSGLSCLRIAFVFALCSGFAYGSLAITVTGLSPAS